jgi:hypothetical protein
MSNTPHNAEPPLTPEPDDEPKTAEGGSSDDGPGLGLLINTFHRTIEGTRDVVAIVTPHLTSHRRPTADMVRLRDEMTKRQRLALKAFLTKLRQTVVEGAKAAGAPVPEAGPPDDREEVASALDADEASSDGPSVLEDEDDKRDHLDLRELIDRAERGELADEEIEVVLAREFQGSVSLFTSYVREASGVLLDPNKLLLLTRAMLVTSVASFETLVAGIFAEQFELFPALLDAAEEARFSLSDLQQFGSIDQARQAAIDRRVDTMMRESFETWEAWLERRAGIQLAELCIDRETLGEVFQRRHVVVHNDARVSMQYIAATGHELQVGARLSVGPEYLERALDELEVLGVALGTTAWLKWYPADKEVAIEEFNATTYGLLRSERYRACARLCEIGRELGGAGRSTEVMRVNSWIARKQLDGVDSIREEVLSWDTSALALEFELARAALLDDFEDALALATRLVEVGGLSSRSLEEWPLFIELRAQEGFSDLLAASKTDGDSDPAAVEEQPPNGGEGDRPG